MSIRKMERQNQYAALQDEFIKKGKDRPTLREFLQGASQKLGVSVAALETYADRYNWVAQAKAWDDAVREVTKTEVMTSQGSSYAKIEGGCLQIAERLLAMGMDYLDHVQSVGDKLPPSQMKAIAESLEKIWGIYASTRSESDIKIALNILSNNHVIPPDAVPQILSALEETDVELGKKLQRVFTGKVPD